MDNTTGCCKQDAKETNLRSWPRMACQEDTQGEQGEEAKSFFPFFMYRMYGMKRAQGCVIASMYRMYGMKRVQGCVIASM